MSLRFFNAFYSEFIILAAKLKFTKEMLLQEFIILVAKLKFIKEMLLQKFRHKLSFYMRDQINSRLEYPDNIKDLVAHCQKIFDQILATDWVQSNIKPANTKVANTPTRFFPTLFQITLSNISSYYPKLENTFSPFTNNKWLKLIKKGRCFYY